MLLLLIRKSKHLDKYISRSESKRLDLNKLTPEATVRFGVIWSQVLEFLLAKKATCRHYSTSLNSIIWLDVSLETSILKHKKYRRFLNKVCDLVIYQTEKFSLQGWSALLSLCTQQWDKKLSSEPTRKTFLVRNSKIVKHEYFNSCDTSSKSSERFGICTLISSD